MLGYEGLAPFTGSMDELDRFIAWKAGSVEVLKHYKLDTISKGAHMQRQFTIELRVDFADRDKLPELKQTLLQCARHAYSTAMLLSDSPKTTQISCYSNDFFSPPEEIKLLDDIIAQGVTDAKLDGEDQDSGISPELAAAVSNG